MSVLDKYPPDQRIADAEKVEKLLVRSVSLLSRILNEDFDEYYKALSRKERITIRATMIPNFKEALRRLVEVHAK